MKYNIVLIPILFNKSHEILLIRRWRDPEKGKWSLPGGIGALETQPNPTLAILNEVKSELGVDYVNCKLFTIKFTNDPEPTLCLYFHGNIQGTLQTNEDYGSQEFKWIAIDEVLNMEIAFEGKDKEVIKCFKEQILSE